jgi:hypothetical protein
MRYFTRHIPLEGSEELEVVLRYRKDSGVSWISGNAYRRGLVLDFAPCTRGGGEGYVTRTYTFGDGRGGLFFLEEWARKTDKRGRAVAAFIEANVDRMAPFAIAQDWNGVRRILQEFFA